MHAEKRDVAKSLAAGRFECDAATTSHHTVLAGIVGHIDLLTIFPPKWFLINNK